jgi:hypothetical protein
MVCHEDIGMHSAFRTFGVLLEPIKIKEIVFFGEEAACRLLPRWMMCSGVPGTMILGRLGIGNGLHYSTFLQVKACPLTF